MKTHRLLPLRFVCIALLLTTLSGGFAHPAFAQRNPVYSSIEAQFAGADSVYLGTIAEVGEPIPTESGTPIVQVVIDVTETLKGEKHKRYPVYVYLLSHSDKLNVLREWSRKRAPLLGFIHHRRNDDTYPAGPDRIANFLPVNPAADSPDVEKPTIGYIAMDFRLLSTPREILDALHWYAKKAPKTARIHAHYYIPNLIGKHTSTSGDLLVPVVPQLEKVAKRMILNPASFLPAESEVHGVTHEEYLAFKAKDEGRIRKLGVQALAHFKSKANIELLKRQLNDPFIEPEWEYEKDFYSVRKRAYETLKKWGVEVAEPQLHRSLLTR